MPSDSNPIKLPPLSLYIHIPWCNKKCPYCDFNVHVSHSPIPEVSYLHALLEDLSNQQALAESRPLHSIFIGGGTPNLLSADFYYKLLRGIEKLIRFDKTIEITIEANPGVQQRNQFRRNQFQGFIHAGINRLSLGIQSFHDQHLKLLGREHSVRDNHLAISAARTSGFANINLDLIYGIPQQSKADMVKDLSEALYYQPEHLSHYQLNIEPNSIFYSQPPQGIANQETIAEATDISETLLEKQGYQHYEISAFSKPDQYSRHNLNYWEFGDYLGIGAGAHSKVTLSSTQTIWRYQKTRKPKDYLLKNGYRAIQQKQLRPQDKITEFMLNAMRLKQGIALKYFHERTGLAIEQLINQSQQALTQGLLTITRDMIKPTELGMRYQNDLLLHYLN